MNTTETRCERCRYLISRCKCPESPLLPPVPLVVGDGMPELLTPGEVAAVFRVDPKTVTRWAAQGKLRSLRTLGGHRRYAAADIYAFLDRDRAT